MERGKQGVDRRPRVNLLFGEKDGQDSTGEGHSYDYRFRDGEAAWVFARKVMRTFPCIFKGGTIPGPERVDSGSLGSDDRGPIVGISVYPENFEEDSPNEVWRGLPSQTPSQALSKEV